MAHHVLVPVDGSQQAETAFRYALDEHPESTLTLLHVCNPVAMLAYSDDDYFDVDSYQADLRRQRERGDRILEELAADAAERGIEVETVVRSGKPARQILEVADERAVDHVVMGSHGRSGVGRVVFGSVAEAVTRRATVPVTIIR
ncbi:universal stress protein [Halomicroarcula sp. GCM10025324]|uniref:universal stress protein n=1 Tax=Haloarcula TaxID=2237 RepID=UPI0023E8B93B|nr:universal stress protein [Halomicroarcula sp. ZS-22-S1]